MFCPKCKYEYREGFVTCSTCNEALVDHIDIESEKSEIVHEKIKLSKIKNAANEVEAWFIIDLLKNNNIPCLKKEREAGEYLKINMGYSVFGANIYVNEENCSAAEELINGLSYTYASFDKRHKLVARVWLIALILSIIFSLIINNVNGIFCG